MNYTFNAISRAACWGNLPGYQMPPHSIGPTEPIDSTSNEAFPVNNLGIADDAVWGTKPMSNGGNAAVAYWGDPKMNGVMPSSVTDLSFFDTFTSATSAVRTAQGSAPHRCVTDQSGELWCGGLNDSGQIPGSTNIGAGVTVDLTPTSVNGAFQTLKQAFAEAPDASTPTIAVGAHHTCAITSGGLLYCFGDDTFGQLGNQSNNLVAFPDAIAGMQPQWVAVAAGARHTCAAVRLINNNTYQVYCWGAGDFGQLGQDINGNEPSFQRLPTLLP